MAFDGVDHGHVVGRQRGKRWASATWVSRRQLCRSIHELARELDEVQIDVTLLGERQLRRLLIGAFAQADRHAARGQRRLIGLGAVEIGLQHCAHVVEVAAQLGQDIEGDIGVRRVLHVDPHEIAAGLGARQQPPDIVDAQPAIDVEPELRQLHRDIRAHPGGVDRVNRA